MLKNFRVRRFHETRIFFHKKVLTTAFEKFILLVLTCSRIGMFRDDAIDTVF